MVNSFTLSNRVQISQGHDIMTRGYTLHHVETRVLAAADQRHDPHFSVMISIQIYFSLTNVFFFSYVRRMP